MKLISDDGEEIEIDDESAAIIARAFARDPERMRQLQNLARNLMDLPDSDAFWWLCEEVTKLGSLEN